LRPMSVLPLRCRWLGVLILVMVSLMSITRNEDTFAAPQWSQSTSQFFRPSGHLNYMYDPGIMVPLRDGTVLCLDGYHSSLDQQQENLVEAADGQRYGYGLGMVELFEPEKGTSKVLTKLPYLLFSHDGRKSDKVTSAIELNDGRIFIVGKFHENKPHTVVEPDAFGLLYDWHNNTCEVIRSTGDIKPRDLVTLHLLPDDRVLILGGEIGSRPDDSWKLSPDVRVLAFDPKSKQISAIGKLKHTRYGHATVPISDTQYMIFGGWGPSEEESKERYCDIYNPDGTCHTWLYRQRTREVELFDTKTGISKIVGHTLTDRCNFSAIALPDGKVFIHGGPLRTHGALGYHSSELYDPATGESRSVGEAWTPENVSADKIPYRLYGEGEAFRAALKESNILLAGWSWAHLYDYRKLGEEAALKKHDACKLLEARECHHLVKTASGKLFVMGGESMGPETTSRIGHFRGSASLIEEFVFSVKSDKKGE
jgi:hypothetical protein